MHPVRPRLAGATLLLALAAHANPTAAPGPAEAAGMGERVRQLVERSVPPPAVKGGPSRVEVEVGRLDPRLRLAPCQRIEPQLPANGVLWGRTHIGLRCAEGERPWLVWLPVVVKVYASALTTARALPAGTVLTAAHLQVREVDWAATSQEPFTLPQDVVGRTLSRALQPGQAVRRGDVRLRQWFAAGDTVRVRARGNGFIVGGQGQAMSAGIEGQSVRVRTDSGRVLTGMPVAANQVEVLL